VDVGGDVLTPFQDRCKSRGRQTGNRFFLRNIAPWVFMHSFMAINANHNAICLNTNVHGNGVSLVEV
jgi:hypothetical protein